ncbi:conjugal transfer protein TraK [Sediminicola luteus]|uniref:Conjugal transfer protein TraK n=1 Tax=Sediminicola luteus TaxID=319238 RepID=A0A2A4G2V1_9FLAO|nr:conjugal transfer protein TraK [Sediminicola luteus]PCE63007.1 hypothetical protein B7P33_17180 [Sediminicola luteus]
MKTPYKNLYSALRWNRLITMGTTFLALLSCGAAALLVHTIYKDAMGSAFVLGAKGRVLPLDRIALEDIGAVEAKSHLDLFHRYFYGLDPATYDTKLEKALWLGDGTVDEVYRQKKMDGTYNRLLQFALIQQIVSVRPELLEDGKTSRAFKCTTVFDLRRGGSIERYELVSRGRLLAVDRKFPENPHGLLITDYFEESLRKIVLPKTTPYGNR